MSDKGITLEGLAAAVDVLRQELATWKALARKQDTLTAAQITATQSGATAAKIDQIAVNTAAIQALSAQVAGQISLEYVTTLPVTGEPFTLYLVPQGDGTAPNYCNEYLWINGDWELIGTTGSMANNGELVIQVNGVAVGTFTANQAANTAVNITVPTNTNQLVNGAQYVDAAALATALALKQNSLNTAQLDAVNSGITAALVTQIGTNTTAIAGKQDALTTAQQAAVDSGATAAKIGQIATNAAAIVSLTSSKQDTLSTAQLAAVNSGITSAAVQQISTNTGAIATKAADNAVVHLAGTETISGDKTFTGAVATRNLTPETDVTYSLGSSSYQWASVYAQTYYYNGTEFQSKFVTADTAQTITGNKTFTGNVILTGAGKVFRGTGTVDITQTTYSDNISQGTITYIDAATRYFGGIGHRVEADGNSVFYFDNSNYLTNGGQGVVSLRFEYTKNFTYSLCCGGGNLGNATRKWRTLNGINPGALSFPSDSYVNLDTTSWDLTGTYFNYTPTSDGWLMINVRPSNDFSRVAVEYASTRFASESSSGKNSMVTCPVRANIQYSISIYAASIAQARFIPCLGNV